MFSCLTPSFSYIFAQAMPAAPAPLNTTRTLPISLPTISSALISAAPEMIAVPC